MDDIYLYISVKSHLLVSTCLPMPPAPGAGLSSSGASTIQASLVVKKLATPLASTSAVLTTFKGSTIPALVMSVNSPLAASYPHANLSDDPYCLRRLQTMTLLPSPAFFKIARADASMRDECEFLVKIDGRNWLSIRRNRRS